MIASAYAMHSSSVGLSIGLIPHVTLRSLLRWVINKFRAVAPPANKQASRFQLGASTPKPIVSVAKRDAEPLGALGDLYDALGRHLLLALAFKPTVETGHV